MHGTVGAVALWADGIADTAINAARFHSDWLCQDIRLSVRGWSRARGFRRHGHPALRARHPGPTATDTNATDVILVPRWVDSLRRSSATP